MSMAEQNALLSAETQAKKKRKGGKTGAALRGAGEDSRLSIEETTNELCPGFEGSLRDYQLKGVQWLISLYQNGLNGILADQMGLGKTIQTIAFLCHMRSKGVTGPFLVLGPLSTLPNWVSEFERWAPNFPAVLYHGSKEERASIRSRTRLVKGPVDASFPVYVTSYEIAIADIKFLQKMHWKYVVVDEGHRYVSVDGVVGGPVGVTRRQGPVTSSGVRRDLPLPLVPRNICDRSFVRSFVHSFIAPFDRPAG